MSDSKSKSKKDSKKKNEVGPIHAFETFIVNLSSEEGERYLKLTVNIEVDNPKVLQEVTKRVPQLRDAIIILLSSKSLKDLDYTDGKAKLKREILARINSFLSSGKAKRVYFTEFVVQ